MKKTTLRDELISSGASQKEAETLTKLATYIRTKPEVLPGLSNESKVRIFKRLWTNVMFRLLGLLVSWLPLVQWLDLLVLQCLPKALYLKQTLRSKAW